MKTKKQYKALKKDICENSAVNVGYYENIMHNLPNYAILEAFRNVSKFGIKESTKDADLQNMIITEAVKSLNFQDFKKVANFFF